MNNIMTQDVCEVYLKDRATNKVYFFGLTTKNEVTQKIKQEVLKAGLGNLAYGVIQSDKDMTFKVTTLFSNDDLIALQTGGTFANGTYTVQKSESAVLTSGKLTITGTPVGTAVVVIDSMGKQLEGTYATGDVTITGGVEGAYYTCVYPESATGEILTLDSKFFPVNYYVELHTIGYNPDTNAVACDMYWVFDKALPDGNISKSFEAGKNNGDDITFTAMTAIGNTSLGKYIVVPRA